jgi:hypothetical protein
MLVMDRQEHIHIVTAGEHIHEAYAAAVRDLRDITHTFVFADTELYTNSVRDDEQTKSYKTAARYAVNRVKAHAASLKLPAHLVYIDPPALESVAQAILRIVKEHPAAVYSFDLSAGSKDLSLALYAVSLWLEGDAYYAFSDRKGIVSLTLLPVPRVAAMNIRTNQNYGRILALLYRAPGKQERSPRVLPRAYLRTQLEAFYVPVRKNRVKYMGNPTGKADATTGKKAAIPRFSQGTFTNLLSALEAGDLIRLEAGPNKSRREKFYRITPSGELALLLFETKLRKP